MAAPGGDDYTLRVKRYFPHVKDFDRAENGDLIWGSLKGPEKIEARQQLSRERVVAAAELKVLHQQLQWCYHANGVNHYEACRELVEKVAAKVKAPYYGMLSAPSREY